VDHLVTNKYFPVLETHQNSLDMEGDQSSAILNV